MEGGDVTGPAPYEAPADPPPPPPPAPPSRGYPTGPPTQPAVAAQVQASANNLIGLNGYATAAAQNIVDNFQSLIGWPNKDFVPAIRQLVDQGLENSPNAAYEFLFGSQLSAAQQQSMPWAELGVTKDNYTSTVEKLSGSWSDFTGDAIPADLLKRGIKENWTPAEIKNYLNYGDPGGAKAGVTAPDTTDTPWIASGSTYTQSANSYYAHTGHQPTDKHTLAAWWNFTQGTQQLGGGQEARMMAFNPSQAPPPMLGGGTEIR